MHFIEDIRSSLDYGNYRRYTDRNIVVVLSVSGNRILSVHPMLFGHRHLLTCSAFTPWLTSHHSASNFQAEVHTVIARLLELQLSPSHRIFVCYTTHMSFITLKEVRPLYSVIAHLLARLLSTSLMLCIRYIARVAQPRMILRQSSVL